MERRIGLVALGVGESGWLAYLSTGFEFEIFAYGSLRISAGMRFWTVPVLWGADKNSVLIVFINENTIRSPAGKRCLVLGISPNYGRRWRERV